MLHDTPTIRIDPSINLGRRHFQTRSFGQFILSLIGILQANPTVTEIAAQQKYLSVVNETQDSIKANMPARIRQLMHFC